jgi:hypothetical protein
MVLIVWEYVIGDTKSMVAYHFYLYFPVNVWLGLGGEQESILEL